MRFIRFILFDREARDLQTIAVHPGGSAFLSSGRGWNGFTARPDVAPRYFRFLMYTWSSDDGT